MKKTVKFFMVYGSFQEPTRKRNFFFMKAPLNYRGTIDRSLCVAINKLVEPWFSEQVKADDRYARMWGKEPHKFWNVDGDVEERLWGTDSTAHYVYEDGVIKPFLQLRKAEYINDGRMAGNEVK
jgi:hypothetical protein